MFSEEEKWEKLFDKAKKMHYWINYATNHITYDEPPQPFAHEHGFLGKRIKVFWIVQVFRVLMENYILFQ
jgi:hypothetical protein